MGKKGNFSAKGSLRLTVKKDIAKWGQSSQKELEAQKRKMLARKLDK